MIRNLFVLLTLTTLALPLLAEAPNLPQTQYHRQTTCQGGYWNEQKWFAGNFDNQGASQSMDDWAKAFNWYGYISIDIHRTDSIGGSYMYRAVDTAIPWSAGFWLTADFDGNGLLDFGFIPYGNSVQSYQFLNYYNASDKKHSFVTHNWWVIANQHTDQTFLIGDYDGIGNLDLYHIRNFSGTLQFEVYSDHYYRRTLYYGSYSHTGGFWMIADFDGDGRPDPVHIFDAGHFSTGINLFDIPQSGSSLQIERWENSPIPFSSFEKWIPLDIDNNGTIDLANVRSPNGLVYISAHLNNGQYFTNTGWVWDQGGYWPSQQWDTADFDGDGIADLGKAFDEGCASIDIHLNMQ